MHAVIILIQTIIIFFFHSKQNNSGYLQMYRVFKHVELIFYLINFYNYISFLSFF